tara:strand:- start:199 stop:423 length:225 start_codon:yes stop_codon:yes gene_type:complete
LAPTRKVPAQLAEIGGGILQARVSCHSGTPQQNTAFIAIILENGSGTITIEFWFRAQRKIVTSCQHLGEKMKKE